MMAALRVVFFAALYLSIVASTATGSPVMWEWYGTLEGSGFYAPYVPAGTPFSFELMFDTNTPDLCPDVPDVGVYLVRGELRLLGDKLPAAGGIESNSVDGSCTPVGGNVVDVKFFVSGEAFRGMPREWILFGPTATVAGALPVLPDGGIAGGLITVGLPDSFIVANDVFVRAVPEPTTAALVASGALFGWHRRRRHRP